jgi:hypothetical protein
MEKPLWHRGANAFPSQDYHTSIAELHNIVIT